MGDGESTGSSLRRSLIDGGAGVVLIAAVGWAVVLGLGVGPLVFEAAEFYLLVLIGVVLPIVYRRWWPRRYEARMAIVWTTGAALVVMVLFWAGYSVAGEVFERPIDVASAAFVFAVVGMLVVGRRAIRRWTPEV